MKRYEIQQHGGRDDGAVVLGPVAESNAYIAAYPAVLDGHKAIGELEVGESTVANYSLSGTKGTYKIVRIEDAPGSGG